MRWPINNGTRLWTNRTSFYQSSNAYPASGWEKETTTTATCTDTLPLPLVYPSSLVDRRWQIPLEKRLHLMENGWLRSPAKLLQRKLWFLGKYEWIILILQVRRYRWTFFLSLARLYYSALLQINMTKTSEWGSWILGENNEPAIVLTITNLLHLFQRRYFGLSWDTKREDDTWSSPEQRALIKMLNGRPKTWMPELWYTNMEVIIILQRVPFNIVTLYFNFEPWLKLIRWLFCFPGGNYFVCDGTVYFSNFSDQRLYKQTSPSSAPVALTHADNHFRYADGQMSKKVGVPVWKSILLTPSLFVSSLTYMLKF